MRPVHHPWVWAVALVFAAATPAWAGDGPADAKAVMGRDLRKVEFKNQSILDVLDSLGDGSGANLFVSRDALKQAGVDGEHPVTYSADKVTLGRALTAVLDGATEKPGVLTHGIVGPIVVVTTPANLKELQAAAARHGAAKEPPSVSGPRLSPGYAHVTLAEAFADLGDTAKVRLDVDWHALDEAGLSGRLPVAAVMRGVSLGDVLLLLLDTTVHDDQHRDDAHRFDYRVEPDGRVTISTVAGLARSAARADRQRTIADGNSAEVKRALDRKLPEAKFADAALTDVVDYCRDQTHANLFVRWDVLEPVGVTREVQVALKDDDLPLSSVLSDAIGFATVDANGADGVVVGGVGTVIVVTTPADLLQLRAAYARHRAATEPAGLGKKIGAVKFGANGQLSDVLAACQRASGLTIKPD